MAGCGVTGDFGGKMPELFMVNINGEANLSSRG